MRDPKPLDMRATNGTAIREIVQQLAALDETIAIYTRLLQEARDLREKVANQVLPVPAEGDKFHSVLTREDGTMEITEIKMVPWAASEGDP